MLYVGHHIFYTETHRTLFQLLNHWIASNYYYYNKSVKIELKKNNKKTFEKNINGEDVEISN